jgi:hypothetical protein
MLFKDDLAVSFEAGAGDVAAHAIISTGANLSKL